MSKAAAVKILAILTVVSAGFFLYLYTISNVKLRYERAVESEKTEKQKVEPKKEPGTIEEEVNDYLKSRANSAKIEEEKSTAEVKEEKAEKKAEEDKVEKSVDDYLKERAAQAPKPPAPKKKVDIESAISDYYKNR